MPRSPRIDFERLATDLKRRLHNGVSSAGEACKYLGISQSTFSRVVTRLTDDLLIVGLSNRTRYALRRTIPDVGSQCPVYRIDEHGKTSKFGTLYAIHPRGFYYESTPDPRDKGRFFEDFPYFLDDLRPNGFLGRLIPKKHSTLGLPRSIDDWTANDSLKYLARFGYDLIGDLILGDEAFQRYLEANRGEPRSISRDERGEEYPKRAIDVLKFGDPGSSAGGEQPKFSAIVGPELTSVLVKFSPRIEDNVSRRRADLVICEHIGLEVIRRSGHSATESELIQSENQVFLEVRRFDRTGRRGRRGLASLRALDAEFVGSGRAWTEISEGLLKRRIIDEETLLEIRWREMFGHLIGNTDMHPANISFYFQIPRVIGLAPVYDMLPMLYAPQNDQIIDREFNPPLPKPDDAEIWRSAWAAGCEFWTDVSEDPRVSSSFQEIARANLKHLQSLKELGELLP
ncbi:type II toxin-antitoxin system HipA family toxin YjjJ [Elusimicrobiota bacterium]